MKNNSHRSIIKKSLSYFSQGVLISIVLVTVLVAVTILLYWQTNVVADGVKKYVNSSLGDSSRVNYGTIKGSLINNIKIDSLSFEIDNKVQLAGKQISISYDLWPLLDDQIKISKIHIDSLSISLIPKASSSKKIKESNKTKGFNLDSLLSDIQNSHFIDSLLAKMPQLELDDFELVTGYLEIADKNLTFENVYINALLNSSPDNFNFELNNLSGYWYEQDMELESLQFQLLGKEGQITLNKFLLEAGNSKIVLTGDLEIETMQALFYVDEFHIDFRSFSGFVPAFENGGIADGSMTFIGSPQDFAIDANLEGSWQTHFLHQLKLVSSYSYGEINIDTLLVKSSSGDLSFQAKINPLKSAIGSLTLKQIKPNTIKPEIAESELNGHLNFDFPTGAFDINKLAKTIKRLTGKGDLVIYKSHYQDFRLDSLRFALMADNGNIEIEQPSFLKIANQARFDIFGELNRENQLDFQIHTALGDLNNLTSALGMDSLYGSYYSDFRAFGDLKNPQIQGDFWINDFQYKKVLLDSISLDLQLSNVLTLPVGSGNFSIAKGMVYDIPIRNVTLNAAKDSTKIRVYNARIFSDENYFETTVDIIPKEKNIEIAIDRLRMEYEKYWLENRRDINLAIDSTNVFINDFNLTGPRDTKFIANGNYDILNNDVNLNLDLKSLNLEPFQQFFGEKHIVEGVLSGKSDLKNILSEPNVTLNMSGDNIAYNYVSIGDFNANLQYDKKNVFIKELFIEADSSKLSVEGDLAFQFDKKASQILDLIRDTETHLKINWANIYLEKYNPIIKMKNPLKGQLDGYLEIEGTVNDPFMRQSLNMSGFKYGDFRVDSLVMFGQYSGGYLILDSLSADFNETSFSLKGYQQFDLGFGSEDTVFADNPFEFYLVSKDDKLEFVGLFNDQLEAIYGDYSIETYISGTPEKPAISSGTIKLDDGKILLSRVKDPIENVNIDIEVEENVLAINAFSGKSEEEQDLLQTGFSYLKLLWSWMLPDEKEKGTLHVDGTINLENILRPDIDLNINMNEFFVDYFVESTKLPVTTNDLRISGQDTIWVTGKLTLPSGEYEVNLEQMQKNMYLAKPTTEVKKPYIAMNLEIEMPGNFVVTSSALDLQNNFKITMGGNLQASRAAGSDNMALIGVLETESGKFTSFNQSFNVTTGTIDFNNPVRINPDLNIITQKRLKDKDFELIITGNLETIRQNIIVKDESGQELNLAPQDKIALLTLGADISMVASNTDSTIRGVGEDVASNVMLTAAERGVEELTGLDKVEISSSDKLLDLQKLKLNNGLKQASISFGKYLTSDLYVEYRTQFGSGVPTPKLSWDAGNRITLQYRLDKRWSLESHYEKTIDKGNNKIQLGLSWEYSF